MTVSEAAEVPVLVEPATEGAGEAAEEPVVEGHNEEEARLRKGGLLREWQ